MKEYNHKKIEKKWQNLWEKKRVYRADNNSKKPKYYVLDMFPYPSGMGLHVGHPKGYIGSDIFARMKRMQGFNVLHPMGYDAFGLPAEQYALEHNIHPRQAVVANIKTFEKQLSIIGLSYDWDRRIDTTDPSYYRFTQWIFLKLYNSWYNKDKGKAEPIETLIKILEKNKDWKTKTAKERQDTLMQYRLAYEGYGEVNWCPKLGTVLANDEVVDGTDGPISERGGYPVLKKSMRQWFLRITAYADRLLSGLDGLDWSNHIKEIQKNWIGKSEGVMWQQKVKDLGIKIEAYDSVPQTFMAQTFCVIAPEHPLVKKLIEGTKYEKPVLSFVEQFKKRKIKNENEVEKEIEGIFIGRYIENPFGTGDLPIWVATFVVADYGTGIVNSSAHDERDFAFAKKYNIPLRPVTEFLSVATTDADVVHKDEPFVEREAISAIIKHWSEDKYLALKWKAVPWVTFLTGGIEKGQTPEEAARAEIKEETGFLNLKLIKTLPNDHSKFYHGQKKENRFAHFTNFYFELKNGEKVEIDEIEGKAKHEVIWLNPNEIEKTLTPEGQKRNWTILQEGEKAIVKNGILTAPVEFKGREWSEVREDIIDYVVKKGFGYKKTNYKMRDAIFARQRYWGEPIPLIHDKDGLIHAIPDKKLPLKLPNVKSYMPTGTGESPLASVASWVKAGYETNTMPGWAGSSWYFLRYMDPKNKKVFADKKAIEYWKDVDMYVGGQEHATGHLLYSRFWYKFLKDYGLVVTEEPFKTLRNQGMILGSDNRKMSKRWGNVINPDDIVKTYGADTLRLYEMFMGPFEQSAAWSEESIIGPRRFLERVWRMGMQIKKNFAGVPQATLGTLAGQNFSLFALEPGKNFVDGRFHSENGGMSQNFSLVRVLHKTIKKVSEDIAEMRFNTAVSALMVLVNEMEKVENINLDDFKKFLQILCPFAPHITEELWKNLGEKNTIHLSEWPKWDEKLIKDTEVKIAVQINGKVRTEMMIQVEDTEEEVKKKAFINEAVLRYIAGKDIKKIIYIKNRLINIVF